jgi:hypothetical protein
MSESKERRIIANKGPNYKVDINNPQSGGFGPEVAKVMAITDEGEVFIHSLSQDGTVRIVVDKTMEVTAGEDNDEGQIDMVINCMNGDICINAISGQVRIKGRDIVLEAGRDLTLKAGRNLNLKGKAKVDIDGNKVQATGKAGNLIQAMKETFVQKVAATTKLGPGILLEIGKSLISR